MAYNSLGGKVKVAVLSPHSMTAHVQQTLPFPWQGGCHSSLQLLIQPWICAPGTHYGWVDQGSVEYKVCQHYYTWASGNPTPDLLILSPMPYPLSTEDYHGKLYIPQSPPWIFPHYICWKFIPRAIEIRWLACT